MDDTVHNIASGKYSILLCHLEALRNTTKGKELEVLSIYKFRKNVAAVVIDECYVLDPVLEKWLIFYISTLLSQSAFKMSQVFLFSLECVSSPYHLTPSPPFTLGA
jgi:hypothetical protein